MLGLSKPDVTLEDVSRELATLKAQIDIQNAQRLEQEAGNNRYEMQMLLNHNTTRRNGILTQEKFLNMCQLIKEVHEILGLQHNIRFSLPTNPRAEADESRLAYFTAFMHTAARLRRPYDFRSVMGVSPADDPDVFIDYLRTLLQKDNTIRKYVPLELEEFSLSDVPHGQIIANMTNFVDEYAAMAASVREGLRPVVNLGSVSAPLLYRNTIQPLIRQALVNNQPKGHNLKLIGLVGLPQSVDMVVKGKLLSAWQKMFDGFTRKDYYSAWAPGDEGRLDKLSSLIRAASPHPGLKTTIDSLFKSLCGIRNMQGRDASLITLLMYTATHYITHRAMVHALASGDTAFTDDSLLQLLQADESVRSLLRLPEPNNPLLGDIHDPERFFTSAQKMYMQLIGTYWDDTVRNWMYKTTPQKVRLRNVVQAKIDERLRVDKGMGESVDEQQKLLAKQLKEQQQQQQRAKQTFLPLKSFSYFQL